MASRYCKYCERQVRSVPVYEPNHVVQLLVTLVTCGIWLPFWMLACVLSVLQLSLIHI